MALNNQNVHGADEMVRKLKEAQAYLKEQVMADIGVEAVNHFKENFDKEGFDGNKWQARKTKRKGSTNSQKILSKSGDLADSITYDVNGNTTVISSDLVYAQIHNEGLQGKAWGKHSFKMPKREFIGPSEKLNEKITSKIDNELKKIFKP